MSAYLRFLCFVCLFTKKGLLHCLERGLFSDFDSIDDRLSFLVFLCVKVFERWGLGGLCLSLVWARVPVIGSFLHVSLWPWVGVSLSTVPPFSLVPLLSFVAYVFCRVAVAPQPLRGSILPGGPTGMCVVLASR